MYYILAVRKGGDFVALITLRLSEKETGLLDDLVFRSGNKTRSDVLRRALYRLAAAEFRYKPAVIDEIKRAGINSYRRWC